MQGGSNFSGGQRQRLAIARALVRHPEILLFDDSFSALDTTTDFNLRTALKKDAATSAKIVIAQRVSSIADAERIVVLDEGRVVGWLLYTSSSVYKVNSQSAEERQPGGLRFVGRNIFL